MDKSKMMMIIIIALLVLLLGTVVGVGVYLINLADSDSAWHEEQGPATTSVLTPAEMRLIPLESMNANLALGPGGRSDNLVVEVVVGLNASDSIDVAELDRFEADFNRSIAAARSKALEILVSRTYDEVRTLEGRAETAELILYALQEEFGSNLIVRVFFNEWTAVRGR
jgi:flagellar basal body-associated protein FliL